MLLNREDAKDAKEEGGRRRKYFVGCVAVKILDIRQQIVDGDAPGFTVGCVDGGV
jgi:hypothetical protein